MHSSRQVGIEPESANLRNLRIDPPRNLRGIPIQSAQSRTRIPAWSEARSNTKRRRRRLSRLRHVPDDGRGAAAGRARRGLSGQRRLGVPRPTTRPTSSGPAARCTTDSAVVLVPGRRRAAVLDRAAAGARADRSARCSATRCGGRWCSSRSASSCARSAQPQTNFTFEDTLTQIGLGYPFLFLLGVRGPCARSGSRSALILVGYWAGVGALSAAGARTSTIRPSACRPTGRITTRASPRTGTRTATSGGPSTLVPEPVPAREAVRRQRRRLPDAQLHPDAGTMILGLIAGGWLRAVGAARSRCGGCSSPASAGLAARRAAARHRHLPGRQAHLDAALDALQRRLVLPAAGGVLLGDRDARLPALGVPAGRHRHELHRRLSASRTCSRASSPASFQTHLGQGIFACSAPRSSRSSAASSCWRSTG